MIPIPNCKTLKNCKNLLLYSANINNAIVYSLPFYVHAPQGLFSHWRMETSAGSNPW